MSTAVKMLAKKGKAAPKKTTTKKTAPKEEAVDQEVEQKEDLVEEKAETKAAPKKTAAKKPAAKKPAPKSDVFVGTVQEIESLTKVKALKMAHDLMEEKDFQAFKLGGVFSSIQANKYWEGVKDKDGSPYDSFKSWMLGEFGMNYRKGMYLVSIYNSLVEAEIEWSQVAGIGWTKLKELSGVLTKENVEEWVEIASGMTTIQLIDYIKQVQEQEEEVGNDTVGTTSSSGLTTITFKVHEDQKETIQAALDKAMSENKTDATSVALDYICMAYLEGASGKKKPAKQKSFEQIAKDLGVEEAFTKIGEVFPEYNIEVTPIEGEEVPDETEDEEV